MCNFSVVCFLLAVTVSTCLSQNIPVMPPVRCGVTPRNIYTCLGNPKILSTEISKLCGHHNSECQRIKCVFHKQGWLSLDGKQMNRTKIVAHFDQFAKDNPAWTPAVSYVKTACLKDVLTVQGVNVNCEPYDIIHCALTGFYKNAQPSQWSVAQECNYTRQFAALCPICPEDCFAAAIPQGSCNACRILPTTP